MKTKELLALVLAVVPLDFEQLVPADSTDDTEEGKAKEVLQVQRGECLVQHVDSSDQADENKQAGDDVFAVVHGGLLGGFGQCFAAHALVQGKKRLAQHEAGVLVLAQGQFAHRGLTASAFRRDLCLAQAAMLLYVCDE